MGDQAPQFVRDGLRSGGYLAAIATLALIARELSLSDQGARQDLHNIVFLVIQFIGAALAGAIACEWLTNNKGVMARLAGEILYFAPLFIVAAEVAWPRAQFGLGGAVIGLVLAAIGGLGVFSVEWYIRRTRSRRGLPPIS